MLVRIYIHCVGFGVARSNSQGNAKASMCGMSNGRFHAFCFVKLTIILLNRSNGVVLHKISRTMQTNEHVYHYTKLDGLEGIVHKDGIKFRVSRHDCMNDPNEFKFGREMMIKHNLANVPEELPQGYVLSFSPLKDSPVMWRLYGAYVSLVFNKEVLMGNCDEDGVYKYMYSDCEYADETDFMQKYEKLRKEIPFKCVGKDAEFEDNGLIVCFIKHKDYDIEPEFRIVLCSNTSFYASEAGIIDATIDKGDIVEVQDDDFKVKKELVLPKEVLAGIIVHEFNTEKFEKMKADILSLLAKRGYKVSTDFVTRTNNAPVITK